MTTRSLHLAQNLSLPLDAVTQKLAWIGTTGSGKTYGASKLAELFWDAGAQFIALDPVGVWYGLRLASNGKKPSAITIPIFGGLHGDVPLESTSGALIADVVVDRTISAIVDVSQFESDAQKARFELADLTGYTVNGHFNNMVGSLHSLGVIAYPSRGGVTLGAMFEAVR